MPDQLRDRIQEALGTSYTLEDAITAKLARLAGLCVIDRKSALSVADAASPQRAGQALGAQYVLRAAVRRARGADGQPRVQVSPVLVRVANGTTRWAGEPQVLSPADPFAVQATIARQIAEELDVALPPLQRCVTMPNGASAARELQEPESRRYRADPRFRALAAARPVLARRPE